MASLAGTRGTETRSAGAAGKPGETSLTTGQPSRSTELLPFGGGLSSFFQDPFFSTFGALDFPGGGGLTSGLSSALTRMKLDIRENDASFEVSADVPGISKDQVELEVDPDNVLHITTAKRDTREDRGEEGGWRYHRQERYAASSSRSVQLPRNVDASGISARVDNGVLRVLIPKLREQASSRKRITVA